jgi:hypothetical protein
MHSYNTTQAPLKLKEYGRNVQKLITQLAQIPDKAARTQHASGVLKIMGILYAGNTGTITRTTLETSQKHWDDLMNILGHDLEIDTPYATSSQVVKKGPQRLEYPQKQIKYRHCGRHIEQLVQQAVATTDLAQQESLIIHVGKLIKNLSAMWNKDNMDSEPVFNIIQDLAGKKLLIDIEKLKSENIFARSTNNKNLHKDKKKVNYRREKRPMIAKQDRA